VNAHQGEIIRFRLCRYNEATGKWHATSEEEIRPSADFGPGQLPPTVQELLETGLPNRGQCNCVWAPEAARVGSLEELVAWLNEYSGQLCWRLEDEDW
jgi:hypothetical protein